ncbi:hypothetical protein QWA68_005074 [Fusarium oxysporum]|nr:hypothetical protein QWA68_005074 [Fusarium oxysporum]
MDRLLHSGSCYQISGFHSFRGDNRSDRAIVLSSISSLISVRHFHHADSCPDVPYAIFNILHVSSLQFDPASTPV